MSDLQSNCVDKNKYTERQIWHSRPSLLLFSGFSAFEMFVQTFGEFVEEPIDMATVRKAVLPGGAGFSSVFTMRVPASMGDVGWEASLLVLGHLSYGVAPTQPFQMLSTEWQSFAQKHPDVWEAMLDDGNTESASLSPVMLQNWRPFIDGIHHKVAQEIEALIGDPRREAVAALVALMKADGRLRPAAMTIPPLGQTRMGGLHRDIENCSYCPTFAVPGGCCYKAT